MIASSGASFWLFGVPFLVIVGGGGEVFRANTRRRLVRDWVAAQGWTLKSCRYRFVLFAPNWLVPYDVEVIDHTGHELSGRAWATGFIRRKVWIDW